MQLPAFPQKSFDFYGSYHVCNVSWCFHYFLCETLILPLACIFLYDFNECVSIPCNQYVFKVIFITFHMSLFMLIRVLDINFIPTCDMEIAYKFKKKLSPPLQCSDLGIVRISDVLVKILYIYLFICSFTSRSGKRKKNAKLGKSNLKA